MTTQELVRRTLLDEHGDFLREAVAMVAAELMEAEISAEIGAGHGEVSGERITHRNGYRPRAWETRVGEIELQIRASARGRRTFRAFWSRGGAVSRRSWRS
jgi:putative transposase